jgi:hypothetical protein
MAAVGVEEDTTILLDFDLEIPCEGTSHPDGSMGHDPNTAAAFMVVSPCCGIKPLQCASRVAFMRRGGTLWCGRCKIEHPVEDYTFVPI